MANGNLGKILTQANVAVIAYECPISGVDFATVNINCANETGALARAKISISTSNAPAAIDTIDPMVEIPVDGTFERNYGLMSPGEKIFITSDMDGIAVRVYGLEKPLA